MASDLHRLAELAREAQGNLPWEPWERTSIIKHRAFAAFIAACDPQTILDLIERVEKAEAWKSAVLAECTQAEGGWHEDDPARTLHELLCHAQSLGGSTAGAVKATERDAARYRWLREGRMEFGVQPGDIDKPPRDRCRWVVDFSPEEADILIDSFIAAAAPAADGGGE